VRTEGQALVHILFAASLRGLIVRGPMIDGRHAFVLARDWLGEPKPVDRDRALAELARRYLAGHGPATDRDLARWAGLPLRDARAGLAAISSMLVEREPGLVELRERAGGTTRVADDLPPPKLLGPFDPALLGWTSREDIVGTHEREIVGGGIFRPVALVKGRAAGTWSMPGGEVVLDPLTRIAKADREALEREAADVERFLG
jgi:hypothetical protein